MTEQKILILEGQKTYQIAASLILKTQGYHVQVLDGDDMQKIEESLEQQLDVLILGTIKHVESTIEKLSCLTVQPRLVLLGTWDKSVDFRQKLAIPRCIMIKNRPFFSGELLSAVKLALSEKLEKSPEIEQAEPSKESHTKNLHKRQLLEVSDLISLIQQKSQEHLSVTPFGAELTSKEASVNPFSMPRRSFFPGLSGVLCEQKFQRK